MKKLFLYVAGATETLTTLIFINGNKESSKSSWNAYYKKIDMVSKFVLYPDTLNF